MREVYITSMIKIVKIIVKIAIARRTMVKIAIARRTMVKIAMG